MKNFKKSLLFLLIIKFYYFNNLYSIQHGLIQATLIGGGRGISKYPPPSEKFVENTPSKFWEILFEKQRKTMKIRLIQLDLALIKLN